MSTTHQAVGRSIEHLSSSTEETSSSVFEMVATIEEIARHIEGVSEQVNETAASTTSLVNTIKGVDSNVERLQRFVSETSGTMEQVTAAIRQVESRTADSNLLSDRVAANADEGMKAVQLTIEGMSRIRGSVGEAGEAITQLGRRSQEIGGILNVIDEVAEQTNLLALNAAIIAAQAGEHGKGFAVVADEIRGLAERTASSTREIGSLIEFFQQEAVRARQGMQDGSRQVEEGSALAERAGVALTKILDSARESSRMAGEIAQTTQEQVQGTQIVVEAVGRVKEMVTQLSAITAEQTARSESIMATVARMRELTDQVKRATLEQAKGGSLITEAIRSVTDSVASIHQATLRQDSENERMAGALEAFRQAGEGSRTSVRRMADASRDLADVIQTLSDQDEAPRGR
jgi:methyl-accepting chemotaxis protein